METETPSPAPSVNPQKSPAPVPTLDDFCRICLLRKRPLLPLTSEFNGTMIPEMLWKISGTLLNVLEQLPRVICERCLTKLDLAYNIAQEFRKQEELLRSFCWKGALVEQLDGFQRTEDAVKEPYSEEVLKKLVQLASPTPGTIAIRCEKEMLKEVLDLQPVEDPVVEVGELLVEQLDDMIEIERFVGEDQSADHFEIIVEENSMDSDGALKESTVVKSEFGQDEESQVSAASVKKELEEDDGQVKVSSESEVLSVLITKVEDEEWIEEEEKSGEAMDLEAIVSCGETDASQDPIWFDEDERVEDDEEEERPKRKPQKKLKEEKEKRVIKSVLNADGMFECKICYKTFPVQKTFLNHLRRHEHLQKGSFQCKQCEKVFGTRHRLSRHEVIHTRDLSCKECSKVFESTYELRTHQSIHLRGKRKCSCCDFVCYTRDQMKEHQQTSECVQLAKTKVPVKPPVLKDTRCPFEGCDYVAQTYGAMYVHKRAKHQATFECDLCDKKFPFANQLKQHETVHTGEKPYQCEVCSKTFRRMFSFKEHMAIHEGEARYDCDICGKTFARPRYLAAHVATHTEKRPFECSICGSCYKTNGELSKHVRAKHESLEYGNGNDLIEEDYNYFEDEIYL